MRYHDSGMDFPRHKDDTDKLHGAILLKRSKEKMMEYKSKR
jgi:hypothetical protein